MGRKADCQDYEWLRTQYDEVVINIKYHMGKVVELTKENEQLRAENEQLRAEIRDKYGVKE